MKKLNILSKSIVGGFLIGIGGTVFLAIDNKIIGALLFSIGLLAICTTEQLLFTGKCSYSSNVKYLTIILFGNFLGSSFLGYITGINNTGFHEKAITMCNNKLSEGNSVILLAILCNILIYFGIEGFKKGQTILLIMCVVVFILSGYEHSIANMYYFSVAREFSPTSITYLGLNIVGNALGGIIVQVINSLKILYSVDENIK